jgi:hypothetical protein
MSVVVENVPCQGSRGLMPPADVHLHRPAISKSRTIGLSRAFGDDNYTGRESDACAARTALLLGIDINAGRMKEVGQVKLRIRQVAVAKNNSCPLLSPVCVARR